jgi:hypothetical protein
MSFAFVAEGGLFGEIREFLKAEHEIDERQEQEKISRDKNEEYGLEISQKWAKTEAQYDKDDDEDRVSRGRTLVEIRQGLNHKYDEEQIMQALEENEVEVAHKPHPNGKRFTLAEHLEANHYAKEFIPGVG